MLAPFGRFSPDQSAFGTGAPDFRRACGRGERARNCAARAPRGRRSSGPCPRGGYRGARHRGRRRRGALAWLRALLRMPRHPRLLRLRVDGQPLAARIVLVANNAYELRLFDLGARPNLTEGRLHLYSASGMLPTAWEERAALTFELDGPRVLRAAIDGEPVELRMPLTCRLEPRALRVLVPPGR